MQIDRRKFAMALAAADIKQWQLAARLGASGASFSGYLRGRSAPPGFRRLIEQALGLERDALAPDAAAEVA